MQSDVVLTEGIKVASDDEIVLDLNGKTISQTKACTESYQMISNNGKLTIKDSGANGKISFTDNGEGDPAFGWGSYTIRNEGTLIVEDGTIEHLGAQNVTGQQAAHMYCAIFQYSGSTVIEDGTIATPTYRSVRLWKGDMTINGGTFDGQVWVQSVDDSAKMTINGGSFEPNWNDGSSVFVGNVANNGVLYDVDFAVTGGEFATKIGCNNVDALAGSITGGTFSENAISGTEEALLGVGCSYDEKGTVTQADLPNAEVKDMGKTVITDYSIWNGSLTEGKTPIDLQIALDFLAKDTPEQAAEHAYGQATTDFFITMDGLTGDSFVADEDCYLAGNYGTFGWIMIPIEGMEIENGKIYPVITSVGFDFTYEAICTSVKDFKCGIHLSEAVLEANPELKVKLELGLSKNMEEAQAAKFVQVDAFEYDVDDLKDSVIIADDVISTIVGDNTDVSKDVVTEIVGDIINNAALKDYTPENLQEANKIDIVLVGMYVNAAEGEEVTAAPTSITYDVTPKDENGEAIENFEKKVTFRLPVPSSVAETQAKVYHEGDLMGIYTIQGSGNAKYVEVSSANFSEYTVEPVSDVNIVAAVDGVGFDSFAAALNAAKAMIGDVTVEIYDKVTLNANLSGNYDSIKFVGKDTDAEIYLDVQGYITATGKKVAFEELILSKSTGGFITNAGFMNVAFGVYDVTEVTYTGCIFENGAYASSGKVTFTDCDFYRSHDKYGLWAYGNVDVTVDGCTFADYRGIKMYAEGAAKTVDLTVKDTDFSKVTDKPAIVLTYGESVELEGNTYSSTGVFELDLDGAPNGTTVTSDVAPTCKNDNGVCGVLVDGKIYTTVAQAATVAKEGSTVTLLHDSTETVEFPVGVTLNKNNYEAAGVKVKDPVAQIGDVKYGTLQEAIDKAVDGDTIKLLAEVTEDVVITQQKNLDLTIDGDGKLFTGVMTVFGKGKAADRQETLVIKNIVFQAAEGKDSCILSPDRTVYNSYSYSHNVTVENCTFKGNENYKFKAAAIRHNDGGDENWTIRNCTVDENMHSMLQVNNVEKTLTIENCTVKSKNGVNLNSTTNVVMTGCTFDVKGYALRTGVNDGGNLGVEKTYVLKNNTLKSECNDGDAVIMFRASTVDANLQMEKNAVSGTTHISGTTEATNVSADANYWDGKDQPVVDGEAVKVMNYYGDAELTDLRIANLEGAGTAENPYKIGTKEELFVFAKRVNDGTYKNAYVVLTDDIDLEQDDWTSIGTNENRFTGTFDGQGHTIYNVWSYDRGFFGYTSTGNYADNYGDRAIIKNLTIDGVEVYNQSGQAVGGLVGQANMNTVIENVKITGYIQVWGQRFVGAVVGQGYTHLNNCQVVGVDYDGNQSEINASVWAVGGIVGHAGSEGGASIVDCSVENVKIYSANYGAGAIAGVGTTGQIEDISAENVRIEAASDPDANGLLVGCNYDKITGESTAKDVDLFVDGTRVEAAQDMAAEVNGTMYAVLQNAIDAAQDGDVVTVLNDIELTETITIKEEITLDLNEKTVTGADGAIVFDVKADTTIKNGIIKGNKSGTSDGLLNIYADLEMNGVTVETSKINALRFKTGGCTATLTNCDVTGAFKGIGGSVWNIQSGTYKAASTSISEQLNGNVAVSGGTFHYVIDELDCAPGYTVVDNGDGTYGVKYAPAAFVDDNNNGVLDEGEAVYATLDPIFANHKDGDVHVVLTEDIVAKTQVDTDVDAHYYFTTNVEEGVTVDFLFEDDWNYIQKASIGENITVNAPYLLAWTDLDIYGTVNTTYAYFTVADVTIHEGALLNVENGDATVQVKNGAKLTVNGTVNTTTLNVWVGESELVVSGANAKVNAEWIDIWDGTPSVVVENGATLDVDAIKASRGGEITVDGATLNSENIELGHNGESSGVMTVLGNSNVSPIKLTAEDSTIAGPAGMNVTTNLEYFEVVYDEDEGIYFVAEVFEAQIVDEDYNVDEKYHTLKDAYDAADDGDIIVLTRDSEGPGLVINKDIKIDFNECTYSFTEGVGSLGTESNGFQILKDHEVVLMNGKLQVAKGYEDQLAMLIQNYANLEIVDMTLDGTGLDYANTSYALSNNSGEVNIYGETNIIANDEGNAVAFDSCTYGNYDPPYVTVDTTGKIDGAIEVSADIAIFGGTFTHPVDQDWCVPGYMVVENEDGTYGVKKDDVLPVINGVKDGGIYNGKAKFTVVDANLEAVDVIFNGEQDVLDSNQSGPFTYYEPGVYTVTAVDINGLTTVITFTIESEHNYDDGVVTAPTCTTAGYTTYTCDCGASYKDNIVEATGHDWDGGKVTTEPTCTKEGVKTFTCQNDATHTRTEAVAKAAHAYKEVVTAPTCEKAGYTTYTCQCGDTYKDKVVEATGHKWDAGKVTTEPTCTKEGVKTFTCQNDKNHTRTEAVGKIAHVYKATVTAPTCVAEGTVTLACTCGDTFAVSTIAATGHKPGAAATCTTAQNCTVCGTELEPAKDHSVVHTEKTKATTSEDGEIVKTCVCGKVISKETIHKVASVKLSLSNVVYNGKKRSPIVTVKDSQGNKLKKGVDYKVGIPKYRKNAGKYRYRIILMGNYSGTEYAYLTIMPKAPTAKKPVAAKKAITAKWNKVSTQVTGYEVMVATDKKFTKNTKTIKVKGYKAVSKKVTNLKANKNYYVKVRTYKTVKVTGAGIKNTKTTVYSKWSQVKVAKTK